MMWNMFLCFCGFKALGISALPIRKGMPTICFDKVHPKKLSTHGDEPTQSITVGKLCHHPFL